MSGIYNARENVSCSETTSKNNSLLKNTEIEINSFKIMASPKVEKKKFKVPSGQSKQQPAEIWARCELKVTFTLSAYGRYSLPRYLWFERHGNNSW